MRTSVTRLLPAVLLLALAACESGPGPVAQHGEGSLFQRVEFFKFFNTKRPLTDTIVTTRDWREAKDQLEWCTILHFHEGQHLTFEFVRSRRYQYGADRKRHLATFIWPVDLDEDPENRSLFLLDVFTEYALSGGEGAFKGSAYAEELVKLEAKAHIVRKTKTGFQKEGASEAEVLRATSFILRELSSKSPEDLSDLDFVRTGYLKLARAMALLTTKKEVDAAVELQKIVSEIDLVKAGDERKEDPVRYDLTNWDYLRLACQRLIGDIKSGKLTSGGGAPPKKGAGPDKKK